jgi:hypothetical protein
VNINGNVSLDGLILNNAGTMTWSGGSSIANFNGPVFNNLKTGVFDAQGDGRYYQFSGTGATFNNTGLVRKSAGTGATTFDNDVTFSGGKIEVRTGTLSLAGGGTTTSGGNFTVESGAVLDLTGGTTRTYIGNYIGTGSGKIRFSSGTLQIGAGGATFNFPDTLFECRGNGTFSGPGVLTNMGTLNITGNVSLNGLTLNNAGTVTWKGASSIANFSGAVFNNQATGVFDAQGDGRYYQFSGTGATFNNSGLVRKSAGTATTTFDNGVTFTGGKIEVRTGTLSLAGGGTTTSGGNFTVASGAVLT